MISVANGVHSHVTIIMTEVSGQSANQSTGVRPNVRLIPANSP